MQRCDECGFEYDLEHVDEAAGAIEAAVARMTDCVLRSDEPATRIDPDVWSPLEYACHVRDVLLVQRERVLLARRTDHPSLVPMGRDERVEHDGYADQPPAAVCRQLSDASWLFNNVLSRLAPEDWDRTLVYNYPDPTDRTLRWVAAHTAHEAVHHLLDVERQLPPHL